MNDWREMDTAPRDGTSVLVVEDGQYFVAWWSTGWTRAGDDYNIVVEPSHWQQLPPYPHSAEPKPQPHLTLA